MKGVKLTTEDFLRRANIIHGDRYDYSLVEYVNAHTKVKIICSEHGIFEQLPFNHLNTKGCLKCSNERQRLSKKTFIERAKAIHGDKYDYNFVEYKNIDTKIRITCLIHGEFLQVPYDHLNGFGCSACSGKRQSTTKGFIEKARKIHGDKYDYSLVDYINSKTKVKIICPNHGEFEQKPNSHLNLSGCPVCKESHGEKAVRNFLNENSIVFEQEKRFENCRNKLPLPFDFYLSEHNTCIEYDGKQHYDNTSIYYSENVVINDKIKNKFCKENNIELVRITDIKNIEEAIGLRKRAIKNINWQVNFKV